MTKELEVTRNPEEEKHMTTTYERANDAMVRDVMERYHHVLVAAGVTVAVLFVEDVDENGESSAVLQQHGYPAAAVIKATSLKERALGIADALMIIDAVTWGNMTDDDRRALLDHELEHLEVRSERGVVQWDPAARSVSSHPKLDDLGRPLLRLRPHDWQIGGFVSVARRHGDHAPEVQAVRRCRSEAGQYYWDWQDPVQRLRDMGAELVPSEAAQ